MKKILFMICTLAAAAALFVFTGAAVLAEDEGEELFIAESDAYCTVRGDTDGDGLVTSADARAMLRHALDLQLIAAGRVNNSELDGVHGITSSDARLALRIAVGLDPRPAHAEACTMVLQEATCEATGIIAHRCEYCGDLYSFGVIPQKQHTALGWDVEKKATCTQKGLRTQTCIYCGKIIRSEVIPMTEHFYGDMQFRSETPDCTRPQEVYRACIHCGHEESWLRVGTPHSYQWVTVTEPTCTALGREAEVCAVCGMRSGNERNTFSLGGHLPGPWVTIEYATLEHEGLERKFCTRCGEMLEERTIPKKTVN